jgi:hypothetical protein
MMNKIKVFWHTTELADWNNVMDNQWKLIKESGLYEAADEIFICGNGQRHTFMDWMTSKPENKLSLAHLSPDSAFYEYPTLSFLHQQCMESAEPMHVLYIHLKGVTRPGDANIADWRDFLNHSVIERWRDCVAALADHDVAGPNWETDPWPHFSGNFWWANSDYVKQLVALAHPVDCMTQNATQFKAHIPGGPPYWRFDHEAWIGSKMPNASEIAKSFATGAEHYNNRYPAENYR